MINFIAIDVIHLFGESNNGYRERGHPVRMRAGSPRSNQTMANCFFQNKEKSPRRDFSLAGKADD
jgi:hypothetical protein